MKLKIGVTAGFGVVEWGTHETLDVLMQNAELIPAALVPHRAAHPFPRK